MEYSGSAIVRSSRLAGFAVAVLVAASCSGGDDAVATTTVTTDSNPAESGVTAATGSTDSTSTVADTNIDAAADTSPDSTAVTTIVATTAPPTTAAPVGPPSSELVLPGHPRYFDALGADAVAVRGATVDGTTTALLGSDGVGYQTWLTDRGEVVTWLSDGELFREVDGLLEPTLFPGGVFPLVLDAEIGFPVDDDFMALARPGAEIDLAGAPGREFAADPQLVLEYQRSDHPEWWEWEAAGLRVEANHEGAIVAYTTASSYTVVPPPNMVDPPPPRDVDEAYAVTFAAATELPEFPAERVHPDADDILARQLVDRATSVHSRAVEQIFFSAPGVDPDEARPVSVDDLDEFVDALLPERFGLSFGTIDEAGGPVIGYEDDVLVIESASGTWFCQVGRPSAAEVVEDPITGSAANARGAFAACASQRG